MAVRSLIAVVDDVESVRRAVGRLVRSTGQEVETFSSAEEFLQSCVDHIPNCVILDLGLPGMSGLELQRRLAERDIPRTPIIFISAHDDPKSRSQALREGAIAFLAKPFQDEALLDAIQSALQPIDG